MPYLDPHPKPFVFGWHTIPKSNTSCIHVPHTLRPRQKVVIPSGNSHTPHLDPRSRIPFFIPFASLLRFYSIVATWSAPRGRGNQTKPKPHTHRKRYLHPIWPEDSCGKRIDKVTRFVTPRKTTPTDKQLVHPNIKTKKEKPTSPPPAATTDNGDSNTNDNNDHEGHSGRRLWCGDITGSIHVCTGWQR